VGDDFDAVDESVDRAAASMSSSKTWAPATEWLLPVRFRLTRSYLGAWSRIRNWCSAAELEACEALSTSGNGLAGRASV
jgi:hypothetical protein